MSVVRDIVSKPGATRIRPCFPCCWKMRANLSDLYRDESTYTRTCGLCGKVWTIFRDSRVGEGARIDRLTWTLREESAMIAEDRTRTVKIVNPDSAPVFGSVVIRGVSGRTGLAALLGEDETKVVTRDAQWARFMQEGAHVSVTVRRWRATTAATLEDFGLEPDLVRGMYEDDKVYASRVKAAREAALRVLQFGRWRLLPREVIARFDALDIQIRRNLESAGFRTHWGRWIHVNRYADWKARHEELGAQYEALVTETVEQWDQLQAQVTADLAAEGERAYGRAKRSAGYAAGQISLPPTVGEFVAAFVARVLQQVPPVSQIRRKYGVDYTCEMIPLASQVASDNVLAQRIQLDAVTAQMAEDIKRSEARKAAEGVAKFVADVQSQIRAEIYDTVVEYLDVLRDGAKRTPNTKLLNLCEKVSSEVFWSDPELEQRIAELKKVASVDVKTRDNAAVAGVLRSLGAEARITLIELDRLGDRGARPDLGLDDDLDALSVVARRGGSEVVLDDSEDLRTPVGRREALAFDL